MIGLSASSANRHSTSSTTASGTGEWPVSAATSCVEAAAVTSWRNPSSPEAAPAIAGSREMAPMVDEGAAIAFAKPMAIPGMKSASGCQTCSDGEPRHRERAREGDHHARAHHALAAEASRQPGREQEAAERGDGREEEQQAEARGRDAEHVDRHVRRAGHEGVDHADHARAEHQECEVLARAEQAPVARPRSAATGPLSGRRVARRAGCRRRTGTPRSRGCRTARTPRASRAIRARSRRSSARAWARPGSRSRWRPARLRPWPGRNDRGWSRA